MKPETQIWLSHNRRREAEAARPKLSYEERVALSRLRREARAAGAVLRKTSAKDGGLPQSVALGVMRRDKYRCVVHGDDGSGEYGGLELHHRRYTQGRPESIKNIFTVCHKAHDEIHNPPASSADNGDVE